MAEKEDFAGWAVLELMGHRRLGGYVRAVELAGSPFFRIDVPTAEAEGLPPGPSCPVPRQPPGGDWVATQFYGPQSVYCLTPCTAEAALAVARANVPAPVHAWELPHRPARAGGEGEEEDGEEDDHPF